jgi:hypothetical protein
VLAQPHPLEQGLWKATARVDVQRKVLTQKRRANSSSPLPSPGCSYAAFPNAILCVVEVSTSKVFTFGAVSTRGRSNSSTFG